MSGQPIRPVRLLDQLRERIRYTHYSLRTEKTYVYWARCLIRFHNLRHAIKMHEQPRIRRKAFRAGPMLPRRLTQGRRVNAQQFTHAISHCD